PARLDRVVEVEPADAGLDDRVAELLVDLEHAVHPTEVDDDRPAYPRRRAPVAVVLPDARHPERHLVLVRDPHDRLDLLDRLRLHDRRRLVVVPPAVPEWVPELAHRLLVGQYVLGADRRGERLEGSCEYLFGERGWERHRHGDTSGELCGLRAASIRATLFPRSRARGPIRPRAGSVSPTRPGAHRPRPRGRRS